MLLILQEKVNAIERVKVQMHVVPGRVQQRLSTNRNITT